MLMIRIKRYVVLEIRLKRVLLSETREDRVSLLEKSQQSAAVGDQSQGVVVLEIITSVLLQAIRVKTVVMFIDRGYRFVVLKNRVRRMLLL
ncbi:hypothetical protein PoB_000734400 [Plakobranchus ocellatus]|uniref:Uncharacterized protein n=1 Tax=Plakobranchus ocellatus TaxID=259542 RepID=A0AAV3YEY1_9GAST|nr:hypothetical protein PoB_000734400 [Plakobranchus ocellatus]